MITISLKQRNSIRGRQGPPSFHVDVYLRGDAVYVGGTIELNCAAVPVETVYHIPVRHTTVIPSLPGFVARMFFGDPGWRWEDRPETKWEERTDAQVHALSVAPEDIGEYGLVYDTGRLWQPTNVTPDGKGVWAPAGFLGIIFKAPRLTPEPLLVMSLRFDDEPGDVSVALGQTLQWVRAEHGRFSRRVEVEEVPLDDVGEPPNEMQDAVDLVCDLLRTIPEAEQPMRILAPFESNKA